MQTEELYFVATEDLMGESIVVTLADVVKKPLILPSHIQILGQVIDLALNRVDFETEVVMHTESISMLAGAMTKGLGSTILPCSAALAMSERLPDAKVSEFSNPT